ncbi:uracil-DNA glycosylase [Calidifontibacter sp. DB0510]|uniref:Type-5 uracil-DNA glycosylase n=1 Tax=Metallococcus carri TaxID=1656884 RepID=A0A967EB09_9MICO|nr:uracil-DNA glycosylase [Metallococcus carri]NHN56805.1 uracil-DNA glycosylase [Metallococcus carri]NOP37818.1 uracil-DNA glycosylase [Calidifontibacter sp. DB2511S]
MPEEPLPHPITGQPFGSPVAPGAGWPGDPADAKTPVAEDAADVAHLAAAASDIAELDARITVCRACPRLIAWREDVAIQKRKSYAAQPYWGRPAAGFGDAHPQTLIVGLAPAAHGANRTGRMFTGDRSGDWLYAALHRAGYANQPDATHAGDGLHLTGLRIVAAVRCAPPDNKPTTLEKATCAPWLDRELQLAAPTLRSILALGSIGWDATLAAARRLGWDVPSPKPRFGHATIAEIRCGTRTIRLVGSYHVSQQNTFTGKLTEQMLDDAFALLRP